MYFLRLLCKATVVSRVTQFLIDKREHVPHAACGLRVRELYTMEETLLCKTLASIFCLERKDSLG